MHADAKLHRNVATLPILHPPRLLSSSMGMPALGGVLADTPTSDWKCRPFTYGTSSSLETLEDSRRAVIYLARSPDGCRSSVNYQSSDMSGWPGKRVFRDDENLVTSNAIVTPYWHAVFCKQVCYVYLGYDYAGRVVSKAEIDNLK